MNSIIEYPIISIVTPSYNQGHFIADTIESVISQRGDFFIDYIIMDGASTDNSVEVIRRYAELVTSKPVAREINGVFFHLYGGCLGVSYRWVSEKDEGQSAAINRGVEQSVGAWVTWLCSDDVVLPNWLADFERTIEELPVDVFFGDVVIVAAEKTLPASGTEDYSAGIFARKRMIIQQPGTIIRKEKWIEAGGLNVSLNWTMDYDLFLRMEVGQCRFFRIREFIAIARIYQEAKTSSGSFRRFMEYVRILANAHRLNMRNFSPSVYILYFLEFLVKKLESSPFVPHHSKIVRLMHGAFWLFARPGEAADIQARFLEMNPESYKKYAF